MSWEWRRLRASELDHELIWLCVTVTSAAILLAWLKIGMPLPPCTFRNVFGIPCPTCGATHAALAFVRGDLSGAWHFNPLATISFVAIACYDAYALLVLVRQTSRLRIAVPRKILLPLIFAAGFLNWTYLLRHF